MVAKNDNDNSGSVRSRANDAYQAARDRTFTAYESARGRAVDVTRQATEQVSVYPVAAVVGGLAFGALIGLLVPSTRREKDLLAPTGKRVTVAAREAAQRGLDAGKAQLDEIRSRTARKVGDAVAEAVGGNKD